MQMGTLPKLDRIDFKILAHLQQSGRCSNVDLADLVGLSPSPCLGRVKRLEEHGFIESYGAQLGLVKFGPVVIVFTEVMLKEHRKHDFVRFETKARDIPEIMDCYNVAGGYDYLMRIVARSVSHYHEVMESILKMDLGVERYFSYFVLRTPFSKHAYPLAELFGRDYPSDRDGAEDA